KCIYEMGPCLVIFLILTKLTKLMKKSIITHPYVGHLMKITFIQTLLICLGISLGYAHTGVSQELLDRKVTLNLDNVEIKKVLVQIERQAKVKFVYSPNAIGATRRVSVVAVNR